MDREYFTVKLHSADVDVSKRIRLETHFAEHMERIFLGREGALLACKCAAAGAVTDGPFGQACAQVTATIRAQGELPSDAHFSISLLQILDL